MVRQPAPNKAPRVSDLVTDSSVPTARMTTSHSPARMRAARESLPSRAISGNHEGSRIGQTAIPSIAHEGAAVLPPNPEGTVVAHAYTPRIKAAHASRYEAKRRLNRCIAQLRCRVARYTGDSTR